MTVSHCILDNTFQLLIFADITSERLDAFLTQVISHGEARFVRRLDFDLESTTVARLQTVLHHAVKVRPELKETEHELFTLSEDFSRLSKIYQNSASKRRSGVSPVSTLVSIAQVIAKIWKQYKTLLLKLIESVPDIDMDPCMRESLGVRLGHIGQYVPAARRLLSHSRKFGIFRSIQVRQVHIEPARMTSFMNCRRQDT
jgi:hypothetical protein